jgi:defect-in-organelle-trafficking protein DotA
MKRLLLLLLTFFPFVAFAQNPTSGSTGASSTISFTPAPGDLTFTILQSWYGVVDNVLAGTGSQLFGTLFGIFNSGVLTLAGIIVTYTLMVSTLNTAQEGEVLGKQFSSVWIPFRTVGGIALLIPKASGYSLIQIFMMWIAVQGIGLADTIWYATIDYFTAGGQSMISISAPGAFANSSSSATPVGSSTDILRSLTCLYAIQNQFAARISAQQNYNLTHPTTPQPVNSTPPDLFGTVTAQFQQIQSSNSIGSGTIYIPGSLANWPAPYSSFGSPGGACGTITWNAVPLPSYMTDSDGNPTPQYAGLVSQINSQKFVALQTLVNSLAAPAQQIANNAMLPASAAAGLGQFNGGSATTWVNGNTLNPGASPLVQGGVIQNPAATYVGLLSTAMNQLSLTSNNVASNNALATQLKQGGWAMAGAAIFTLTQQSQSASSVKTAVLALGTTAPTAATTSQGSSVYNAFTCSVDSSACNALNALLNGPSAPPPPNSPNCGDNNLSVSGKCSFIKNAGAYSGQFAGAQQAYNSGADVHFGDEMGEAAGKLGEINSALSGLSAQQSQGANPLVVAASLGSVLINVFMMMWLLGAYITTVITAALAIIPSVNLSNPINTLLGWIMSFLSPFIAVLFTVGIILAFYLPMIPYILFTFGVIGWFITVLEAMIAAPLVAIGITHPEGHAILGKADPAVLLIVNVFLRPTLMILGMLGGIFLSYAGVWLLNSGFGMAWNGATGPVSGIAGIFTGIGGVVVYTIIAVQIVQKSFSLVYVIPDQVFKWIGGNIQGMGGEAEAEQKIAGGVQKGAEATGGLVKTKIAGDEQGKGGLSVGGGGSLDGKASGEGAGGGGSKNALQGSTQLPGDAGSSSGGSGQSKAGAAVKGGNIG